MSAFRWAYFSLGVSWHLPNTIQFIYLNMKHHLRCKWPGDTSEKQTWIVVCNWEVNLTRILLLYTNWEKASRILAIIRCPHPFVLAASTQFVSSQFLCNFKITNKSRGEMIVYWKQPCVASVTVASLCTSVLSVQEAFCFTGMKFNYALKGILKFTG